MKPRLTEEDFAAAANELMVEIAALKAVCGVEAPHGGFFPDDTPTTLFEGHKFHEFTGGHFDITDPTLSYPRWTRAYYGATWEAEKVRLTQACVLDKEAALMAASWGKFQIMGFNFADCAFESVDAFVAAMYESEHAQLEAFVHFITHGALAPFLRRQDWAQFAYAYNGPNYEANHYAEKLADNYKKARGV